MITALEPLLLLAFAPLVAVFVKLARILTRRAAPAARIPATRSLREHRADRRAHR